MRGPRLNVAAGSWKQTCLAQCQQKPDPLARLGTAPRSRAWQQLVARNQGQGEQEGEAQGRGSPWLVPSTGSERAVGLPEVTQH